MPPTDILLPWPAIFDDVDGEPIEATVAEFDDLSTFFSTLGDTCSLVADAFNGLVSDANASFEGETAEAFRDLTGDVGDKLGEVPDRAWLVSSIFGSHATDLDSLRVEANAALARANTRWHAVQDAKTEVERRDRNRNNLAGQIDQLDGDADNEATRIQLSQDHETARLRANTARNTLDQAEDDLATSRTEWSNLRDDYAQLDWATGQKLEDVDMGALKDPGWLSQAWGAVSGFVTGVLGDIVFGAWDFVAGLATGDWSRMAFGLSRFLGGVLTVLSVVALFTPIGPGVILILAASKLALDSVLMATETVDPRTGNTIGGWDLAFTGLAAAGSGVAVASAMRGGATFASTLTRTGAQAGIPAMFGGANGGPGQLTVTVRSTRTVATNVNTVAVASRHGTGMFTAGTVATATASAGTAAVAEGTQAASTIATIGTTSSALFEEWSDSPFTPTESIVTDHLGANPVADQVIALDRSSMSPVATYGTITIIDPD